MSAQDDYNERRTEQAYDAFQDRQMMKHLLERLQSAGFLIDRGVITPPDSFTYGLAEDGGLSAAIDELCNDWDCVCPRLAEHPDESAVTDDNRFPDI